MAYRKSRKIESDDEEDVVPASDSSDDSIENEEELIKQEGADFIDDGEESGDDEVPYNYNNNKKKNTGDSDEDDDEDENSEDEENLQDEINELHGISTRKGRLQRDSSDEEEDNHLRQEVRPLKRIPSPDLGSNEENDENEGEQEEQEAEFDDLDDFIVDNRKTQNKSRHNNNSEDSPILNNPGEREAMDLFGCDTADLVNAVNYDSEECDLDESNDIDKKELYNPEDLERGFHTEADEIIRMTDLPERFQKKSLQFENLAENDKSLKYEATIIFEALFQERFGQKKVALIQILTKLLHLIRSHCLEVPYIDIYEKDNLSGDGIALSIADLWQVFDYHLKWKQLIQRISRMLEIVDDYQKTHCQGDSAKLATMELLTNTVKSIKTLEEVQIVKESMEFIMDTANQRENRNRNTFKSFRLEKAAKLDQLARMFGLEPHHFSTNLNERYMQFPIQNCELLPIDVAKQYVCRQFPTTEKVLRGARAILGFMISKQLFVQRYVDEFFRMNGKIRIRPVPSRCSDIDSKHDLYNYKYVTDKPLSDFEENHDFLLINQSEKEKFIIIDIYLKENDNDALLERLYGFFCNDECNAVSKAWNSQRKMVLSEILETTIIPGAVKKYRKHILETSQNKLASEIATKIHNQINIRPFGHEFEVDDPKIMGLSYDSSDPGNEKAAVVVIDDCGIVLEHVVFKYLTKHARSDREKESKREEISRIMELIRSYQIMGIAITGHCKKAHWLQNDIRREIDNVDRENEIGNVNIFIIDPEFAKVYETSMIATNLHPQLIPITKQAVGVALNRLDPLLGYSRLMNYDMEIKKIRWHSQMGLVNENLLMTLVERKFVEVVASAGVDINMCLRHPSMLYQLQFVPGLGIRKAKHLIDQITEQCNQKDDDYDDTYSVNISIVNRAKLITEDYVGPKVALNCAPFLRIVGFTQKEGGHILDETRINPMNYECAHKIAIDALDLNDPPTNQLALRKIVKDPMQLNCLDLDAFVTTIYETENVRAQHLISQITTELQNPFQENRPKFANCTNSDLFWLYLNETQDTFDVGTISEFTVMNLVHRAPKPEELDDARPKRNERTGYFICPFCQRDNFMEISNIWLHFEDKCPGRVVGVNLTNENGVSAFLSMRNISDKYVKKVEDFIQPKRVVTGCIMKIDYYKMKVDISLKQSDLAKAIDDRKSRRDRYYDETEENREIERKTAKVPSQKKTDQNPFSRVTFHPNFKNINYNEFQQQAVRYNSGDFVIRPSSKGHNHLTISWKISKDLYSHIDILEEEKENEFSIGKVLIIESEKYEDLDDVIANYLQPMIGYTDEIYSFQYFRHVKAEDTAVLEQLLMEEKHKNPKRTPYFIVPMYKYPGRYNFIFMPNKSVVSDSFLITNRGYRCRSTLFHNLKQLLSHFKSFCQDSQSGRREKRPFKEINSQDVNNKRRRI